MRFTLSEDVELNGIPSSERHFVRNATVKQLKDLTASEYDTIAAVVNGLNGSPCCGSGATDLTMATYCGNADVLSRMQGRKDKR